jgi:hypothetical protein
MLVAACTAFLFLGCGGPKGVRLQGKLVKDGMAYTPPQGATLSLSFTGAAQGAVDTYAATVNPADGTFVVNGVKNAGIPPGKYKVMMNLAPESTDPAALAKMAGANALFTSINGKECEISEDAGKPLTIDISTGRASQ